MWKRIAMVGLSAGTLVAAGLVGAAPASAGTSHAYCVTNPKGQACAGYGEFDDLGEWFYACDELADGYGVKVDWYVVDNPSNNGSAWDRDGANGNCASSNGTISEGKAVNWRICFTQTVEVSCTGFFRDYA
jgi:hypothetical protein